MSLDRISSLLYRPNNTVRKRSYRIKIRHVHVVIRAVLTRALSNMAVLRYVCDLNTIEIRCAIYDCITASAKTTPYDLKMVVLETKTTYTQPYMTPSPPPFQVIWAIVQILCPDQQVGYYRIFC